MCQARRSVHGLRLAAAVNPASGVSSVSFPVCYVKLYQYIPRRQQILSLYTDDAARPASGTVSGNKRPGMRRDYSDVNGLRERHAKKVNVVTELMVPIQYHTIPH